MGVCDLNYWLVHADICLSATFGHANFKQVAKVSKIEAVEGLPKFGKVEKTICGACQMGKQTKASHHDV